MQRCKNSDHQLHPFSKPHTQQYRAFSSVIRDTFKRHLESGTMAFLHCLLRSSSSKPHGSYKKYLHPCQAKNPLLENLRRLASRCFRGCPPRWYRQLAHSEMILPCVIYEDLPDYEDSGRRDAAGASSQPVGVLCCPRKLVLSSTFVLTSHQRDGVWDFNDLNINVTIKDPHGDSLSSQNFSSRWGFLCFLREQIDQIQDNRVRLEQRVAALRRDVDEAKQQNAEARELKELL